MCVASRHQWPLWRDPVLWLRSGAPSCGSVLWLSVSRSSLSNPGSVGQAARLAGRNRCCDWAGSRHPGRGGSRSGLSPRPCKHGLPPRSCRGGHVHRLRWLRRSRSSVGAPSETCLQAASRRLSKGGSNSSPDHPRSAASQPSATPIARLDPPPAIPPLTRGDCTQRSWSSRQRMQGPFGQAEPLACDGRDTGLAGIRP